MDASVLTLDVFVNVTRMRTSNFFGCGLAADGCPIHPHVTVRTRRAHELKTRRRICAIRAGIVFVQIGSAVTVSVSIGVHCRLIEILELPSVGDAIAVHIGNGFNSEIIEHGEIGQAASGRKVIVVTEKDVAVCERGRVSELSDDRIIEQLGDQIGGGEVLTPA